jgi:acyl-CoA dehydrogenase
MSDTSLLHETVERLLTRGCTSEARGQADDSGLLVELWATVAEAGLPWVSVPETAGGVGGTVVDACTILRSAGGHAAGLPIAETGFLGGWLLASAGMTVPDTPVTVGIDHPDDVAELRRSGAGWALTCRLHRVPWASRVSHVVMLVGSSRERQIVSVPTSSLTLIAGHNVARESRDTVTADGVIAGDGSVAPAPEGVDQDALRLRGALARTVQMVGAMETVTAITLSYANNRVQFGRSISQFQAVQQHLVRIASETAAAALAAEVAVGAYAGGAGRFEVGVAKANASAAAGIVAGLAHQVHGAIGMTQEYELHHYTRRLWAWRQEFGSERWWCARLGGELLASGADRLWDRVATGLMST